MEPITIVLLILGVLAIVTRIPMILWPTASSELILTWLDNPLVVRLLGVGTGALGAGLVAIAPAVASNHPSVSGLLGLFGWIYLFASVWLLVSPRSYASLAKGIFDAFDDPATIRILSALGVGFGIVLVWAAFALPD